MRRVALILTLAIGTPAVIAASAEMPAPLELRYELHYGNLTVGHIQKKLTRNTDGSYQIYTRSRPEGMARIFTNVEWVEEGRFDIVQGRVRPLSFLEYRIGADKPHRHEARFDWKAGVIRYDQGAPVPIPPDTQDQGSLLFAFMLNPPAPGPDQKIHLSGGKKLKEYRYARIGAETLKTKFGPIKTVIVERRPLPGDKEPESFRIWLAVDHLNLPVRISTEKRGQETTLWLDAASGLPGFPPARSP
jgi:hypothetical protein